MNIERTNVEIMGDDNDIVDDDVRADDKAEAIDGKLRKLIVFSGNDYLGLSSHPMVSNAAIKAAQEHGMGPRGSALIFNQIVSIESFQCSTSSLLLVTNKLLDC
ncbi:PREDICTED: 5-aminolevulinate synthase, nonspecific, mitochondrial-like isoform X3 [Erythranthe guttata]|nr:PREDICTED: 5-aminolevulinate synthase, nonspecific, mitochondrial-like isoform X3 [Erythranthe guttata]|eukprot:XP_012852289.1 PREDICTED: 5-aminolevulinate synthase, nonspecific, mitochondrial-like isoform X3 [Erythranthe guttata]